MLDDSQFDDFDDNEEQSEDYDPEPIYLDEEAALTDEDDLEVGQGILDVSIDLG